MPARLLATASSQADTADNNTQDVWRHSSSGAEFRLPILSRLADDSLAAELHSAIYGEDQEYTSSPRDVGNGAALRKKSQPKTVSTADEEEEGFDIVRDEDLRYSAVNGAAMEGDDAESATDEHFEMIYREEAYHTSYNGLPSHRRKYDFVEDPEWQAQQAKEEAAKCRLEVGLPILGEQRP